MIISIYNQKGGVGKTTTAVNLAAALVEIGERVLLIDLDSQANASALCGVRSVAVSMFDVLVDAAEVPLKNIIMPTPIQGVDVAPGHRALAGLESALRDEVAKELLLQEALDPVLDGYDTVLIDNGPSLGLAPAMSLCAADLALIPLQCERMALEGLSQVFQTYEKTQRRINHRLRRRVLLTMLDGRLSDSKEIVVQIRARLGDEVCATVIRNSSKLKLGQGSVFEHAPNSPAAADYRALAVEIRNAQNNGSTKAKTKNNTRQSDR